MKRRLLVAADAAIVATVVYAMTLSGGWPFSSDAHLALAWAGLTTGDLSPHPLWGRAVSAFGLNAGTVSVLAGGLSVGLLAWNVSRVKGIAAGLIAAILFAFSPTAWRVSTHVGSASFDLMLALLALTSVGGKRWRLSLPFALAAGGLLFWDVVFAGLADGRSLMLDGMAVAAMAAATGGLVFGVAVGAKNPFVRRSLAGTVALCSLAMPAVGLLSPSRSADDMAETLAAEMLGKVGPDVKWLVADGVLEDALLRQLAVKGSGPFLVCTARDRDGQYLTGLANRVAATYPRDGVLRVAATIGVKAFLEELPLVDTNRASVAFVWQRSWWPAKERERLVAKLTARSRGEADPLWPYVRERLDRLARTADGRAVRPADPAQINALVDRFASEPGTNRLEGLREKARDLLRADRMNPLGNAVLGSLTALDGNLSGAEFFFRRAVARGNVPALVYNDYAETLRRLGKLDEAARMARRAVELEPSEWRAWETLADVLAGQNADTNEVEEARSRAERLSQGVKNGEKCARRLPCRQ